MSTDSSSGPLKEIMDQSASVQTDPAFGSRTLDLGSIYPNPTTSSTSPLASSIQSIPSYTPPSQQPQTAQQPQQSAPAQQGFGGAQGANGPAASVIAPVSNATQTPDIVGKDFDPNNQSNNTLVSGPDSNTVLQGSSFLGGQGFDDGSSGNYAA
jgi:hypothetical protein